MICLSEVYSQACAMKAETDPENKALCFKAKNENQKLYLHVVILPGGIQLIVVRVPVTVLVGLRQVHHEGPGVEDLPGHGHCVQPVRGVEAVVGRHRGRNVRHVHREVFIIVENLELIRVGVAIELKYKSKDSLSK